MAERKKKKQWQIDENGIGNGKWEWVCEFDDALNPSIISLSSYQHMLCFWLDFFSIFHSFLFSVFPLFQARSALFRYSVCTHIHLKYELMKFSSNWQKDTPLVLYTPAWIQPLFFAHASNDVKTTLQYLQRTRYSKRKWIQVEWQCNKSERHVRCGRSKSITEWREWERIES